uniref:Cleavage and polyadenylation specificity factor subunit 7 n=1 Tax=Lygus hesperus TaxID=30085 RepID=A0A0A9XA20_LYGHE
MATGEDEIYQTEGDDLEDLYDEVIMSGSHGADEKIDDKSANHQNNGKIPTRPMNRNLNMSRQFQLYIGNLTWWTSDKDILDAILNLGVTDYVSIKIFDNRSNGQSKGFCQVTFNSEESSKTVMEMLPKSDIHGKHPVVCYPSKQAFANFDSQTKPQMQGGGNKQQKDQGHQGMGHPGPNHGPPHHHGPRGPPPMRGPPPHMGPQGPRMPPPHMQGNFMHHQMPPRGPPMQQPPMRPQHPPPHFQQGPPLGPPPQGHQGPPPPGPHHNMPPGPRPEWRGPPQQPQGPPGPPPYIPTPNMGGPPPAINVQQQPPFYQHQAPPPQGPPPPHPQGPPQPLPPQRYNYGQPPQVQVPPSRPPPQIRTPPSQVPLKPKTVSDAEFEDIMARNRNVSSSAITRAVCDAAAGEYASAIETLVTAITLIKQSKVAHDDRCKILINSLEDTLRGVEPKPYSVKREVSRSPSRERDRDRATHAASRTRRDRSRSRDRYRDRSRERHTRDSRDHKDRYYEYRERERDRDRDRSWERERERERDRERDRERKHAKSPEHTSSSKYRSSSDQVSSR